MKTRLESREETLNLLSTELHDNIGQLLSSSRILIGTAERMIDKPSEQLHVAGETISKAIHELRAISKSLNTEWLEKFSLIENLQAESDRITTSKEISVTLKHPPVIEMPADRQLMLFRIVQEALQNTIKHGEASCISIAAEQKENTLQISISDDGKGFDVNDETIQGVGIMNIKHRTKLMSGAVQWNSTKDGTSVIIQLPLYAS
jgi:signal transduction histidine kinase